MSEISEQIRAAFFASDEARDAGLTTPPEVVRFDDIPYGDDPEQVLDVYRPRDAGDEVLPVIVSVHGGGWVYGDKERYQYYTMELAKRGFAVVNFTYRLAPEHRYPAALEDTNAVFRWVLEHAEEYGFSPKHVFGVGDSAGAHLLGLYTGLCTVPETAARYEFEIPNGFVPRAVALNCGKFRMAEDAADELTGGLLGEFLPEGATEEDLRALDVVDLVTDRYPPVLLMTANEDFLRGQALIMAGALMEQQVPFRLDVYGSKAAPLGHVFHCNVRLEAGQRCNDEQCEFFWGLCRELPGAGPEEAEA